MASIETIELRAYKRGGIEVPIQSDEALIFRLSIYGILITGGAAHIEFPTHEDQHKLAGLLMDLASRIADTRSDI